jgi:hypothetical protein
MANLVFYDKPEPCVFVLILQTRIVYATLWEAYRSFYVIRGKGSGMYKSIDGGDTWKSLNENQECQLESKMESQFLQ